MEIFVSHSSEHDYKKKLYEPLRNSQINKNHEIFLPHEDGKDILTRDVINNSDILIAEVSHPSTGQGIELGWANAFNIPIVCIHKENFEPSGSLKYLTKIIITYKNSDEIIEKLTLILDNVNNSSETSS